MAPIPVYTDSPIAAKPSGVTPQTTSEVRSPDATSPATTTASPSTYQKLYPAAQPGATPFIPMPTGATQPHAPSTQPTPTQSLGTSPPPPQPGAAPRATAGLPPPPKAGEKLVLPQPTAAAQLIQASSYPQQMSIPPPTMAYPAQQSGTATTAASSSGPGAVTQSLEHPPGYHQNVNASELDRYQRLASERSESEDRQDQYDDGVWNTAKKWAQATGEKLAAAESEIWKKINKD